MIGAEVDTVVDTEGKFGEAGRGPVADLLPKSLCIHVHMRLLFKAGRGGFGVGQRGLLAQEVVADGDAAGHRQGDESQG